MKSLKLAQLTPGIRVFVRCDLDVPVKDGEIQETYRLDHALPTIKYLLQNQAKVIIAGHMGRPKAAVPTDPTNTQKNIDESLSTKQLLPYFNTKLSEASQGGGSFELLENLRFHPGEATNDPAYAQELARLADIYVNESFATSHRDAASIVGLPKLLPAYAGFRLETEVITLKSALNAPKRPSVAIVGGAKIDSKKPVIEKFLASFDSVLVGGKIAMDWKDPVPENLYLATDYLEENKKDIGPETIQKFTEILPSANTIVWAGPLGLFEEGYINGTKEIALAATNHGAFTVAGGGDTIAALEQTGLLEKFSFISTGGSAMLEFLVEGTLPGLEALENSV